MACYRFALVLSVTATLVSAGKVSGSDPDQVRPLVERYCVSCHDAETAKGGLNLAFVLDKEVARHPQVWEKVVRRLRGRQMPPAGKKRPDEEHLRVGRLATRDRPRSRGGREAESGSHRHHPAADSHRVPERHSRSARHRHRRGGAAAGGRSQPRVRQRDGRRSVADAAGPLHHGGAEDQPAGGRQRAAVARRRHDPRRPDITQEDHVDGLPLGTRGGTLDPLHVPAGRRVRHPDPARPRPQRARRGAPRSRTNSRCCSTASA